MTRISPTQAGVFLALLQCSAEPAPAPVAPPPPNAEGAAVMLDRLDLRMPLPLLPMMANHQKQNMRDHLVVVQEIVAALATSDFGRVEQAAKRIGLSEQMGQMCTHMGAGAPGFTAQALEFHETADRVAAAARASDGASMLSTFAATLQACTSCHAAWKQQVVDESTWARLTSR
jgi:hypothetical protein